jgi:predicted TIM-barrel fold metal-dependent hydrolase
MVSADIHVGHGFGGGNDFAMKAMSMSLTAEDRRKVFETNATRVYRLDGTEYFKRRG